MENRNFIYAGAAALLILVLAIIFWPESQPVEPEPIVIEEPAIQKLVIAAPVEEVEPEEVLAEAPALPLAPRIIDAPSGLNSSDADSRNAASDLSVQLGRWLVPAEQIRKWVVFLDRAADGDLQSKHRPWAIKLGAYTAAGSDEAPKSSAKNHQRYKPVVSAVEAVPVEKLAYYIEQWAPLFDEAYQELGRDGSFRDRILMALDQVLAVEDLPSASQALVRPSVMYKYADVRLESASDIQKLLWRMGPENAASLQTYAMSLRKTMNAPPEYQPNF